MSPSSDDLRALLAERADSGPVTAPFDAGTGARLAGVRARIRQRRRARAAASTLAVVLVAGSATAVTARLRHEVREPQPAQEVQLPARDLQDRPLAVRVQARAGSPGSARIAVGTGDLHLALRCPGLATTTAVALLNGRVVAHTPCGAPGGDVTITPDQENEWGLSDDTVMTARTVSLLLVKTPDGRSPLRLADSAVDPEAGATVGVYTTGSVEDGGPSPAPEPGAAVLGRLALPVTINVGTWTMDVVAGGPLRLGQFCRVGPGQAFTLVVTVDGRRNAVPCTDAGAAGREGTTWATVAARPGDLVRIRVQVARSPDAGADAADLDETLPGAAFGLTVTGTPYLPDALQGPSLLSPPEVDAEGRPLVLSLVAGRGRSATATVRTPSRQGLTWQVWCPTDGSGADAELSVGDDRPISGCAVAPGTDHSYGPIDADGLVDVRFDVRGAGPRAAAVLALYGQGTVLRVVQQAPGSTDPAAMVTTTPPGPRGSNGGSVNGREEVLTAALVARGGQRITVRTRPSDRYGFTVSCRGVTADVKAVVVVDGVTTEAGDKRGPQPCEGTVRGASSNIQTSATPHSVELRVAGPEGAVVTVGVFDAPVVLP